MYTIRSSYKKWLRSFYWRELRLARLTLLQSCISYCMYMIWHQCSNWWWGLVQWMLTNLIDMSQIHTYKFTGCNYKCWPLIWRVFFCEMLCLHLPDSWTPQNTPCNMCLHDRTYHPEETRHKRPQPSPSPWQLVTFLFDTIDCVHAYKLTIPMLVFLLFALMKARAAGRNVGNLCCLWSWYPEKAHLTCSTFQKKPWSVMTLSSLTLVHT